MQKYYCRKRLCRLRHFYNWFQYLKIFDHSYNDINGGSSAYLISHNNSKYKTNQNKINKILLKEKRFGIEKVSTYKKFKRKINLLKQKLNLKIKKITKNKKIIHGYAAST